MAEFKNAEINRDLDILENIENNPNATQASIASQINVAVGTVNWHLKRLVEQGFVEIKKSEKRKLIYLITPEGIAHRKKLTNDYIHNSFELYRLIRGKINKILDQCLENGYNCIFLDGSGDVEDVCKLTCMERNIHTLKQADEQFPILKIKGLELIYTNPLKE